MAKPISRECITCANAHWSFTPTGRIKQNQPGQCTAPEPDLSAVLPASICNPPLHRIAIWKGDGKECPTWELQGNAEC
jgi:hypothetical protein